MQDSPLKHIFFSILFVCTLCTLVTHAAQFLGLDFEVYAKLVICCLLLAGLGCVWSLRLSSVETNSPKASLSNASRILLLFASLFSAYVSVSVNRPDLDDFYYLPNAVYAMQHSDEGMSFDIHYLYSATESFLSYTWATSLPFEYTQAALAYIFEIELLDSYYIVIPLLFGVLLPFSLFLLTRQFTEDDSYAALGTLVAILVLALLGETHRSPLNFSFTRAYQGKAIFLTLGIPLFAAFSVEYLREGGRRNWIVLCMLATCFLGATASAIVLLPSLSLCLAGASLCVHRFEKSAFKRSVIYFFSLGYLFLSAAFLLLHRSKIPGFDSSPNRHWPKDFYGHFVLLWSEACPITPIVLGMSLVLAFLFLRGVKRELLVSWFFLLVLLFLNPFTAPFIIEYISSPNLYWRFFYLLPVPFVVAVAVGSLHAFLQKKSKALAYGSVALLIGITVILQSQLSVSVFRNPGVRFDILTEHGADLTSDSFWKLDRSSLIISRRIREEATPGVMLAPSSVAGTIGLLDSRFPQLRVRNAGVRFWFEQRNRDQESQLRIKASSFLRGETEYYDSFRELVTRMNKDIETIVVRRSVFEYRDTESFVFENGFTIRKEIAPYYVLTKMSQEEEQDSAILREEES